ncbi:MAG: YggS family pyridoxal phosphate-dependent enzyme [Chthoniobacterales bacterium]|nr:YggS family pyridoxal phosphate-dependent enzyme [Chthoniobacterales bacterium]
MNDSQIAENLAAVREQIAQAARAAARKPEEIELVAVTKTHPPAAVRAAMEAGQRIFGESRVQEALAKIPLCPGGLKWHFIGHLQRNKVRKALPMFDLFHGVDSLELAEDMNRIAEEEGHRPRILLEVNTSGEASKFGFKPEALFAQIEDLLALPRLEILGLMTMAPLTPKPEMARPYFAKLRELKERLEKAAGICLKELSMGMSGDFLAAIQEGATLVRIGTAIFGERSRKE